MNMKFKAFLLPCIALLMSCNDDWLSVKRDISLTIPSKLEDVRALLNNNLLRYDNIGLAELSAGEYEISDVAYNARQALERNGIIWAKDIYEGANPIVEWDNTYQQVLQCNVALETLANIHPTPSQQRLWDILYGEALFFRAKAFFNMAQLFAAPYDPLTVDSHMGIPLRLTADVNEKTSRAGLRQTYDQIIRDLTIASLKLDDLPLDIRQTSRPAAFAALARCYLVMHNYEKADLYADSALQLQNKLLDFNAINTTPTYPITPYNEEIILSSTLFPVYGPLNRNIGSVPNEVMERYASNDLRRSVFFIQKPDGSMGFRGSYLGSGLSFHGTTVTEMLLVRAECAVRSGNTEVALTDLITLWEKRYVNGSYPQIDLSNPKDILDLVLLERRKELIGRGARWMDLRRLNLDPERAEVLSRSINGVTYTLPPNDPRYVLPIPDYIVQATGIAQNER